MKISPPTILKASRFCRLLAMGLALAYSTTGCLVIPIRPVHSGYARTNVTEETATQFEPGKVTMADVILQLGEPDAVSADESQLAYRSEKVVGWWIIAAASPGGGGGEADGAIYKDRIFVFEFDPSGQFQTARQSRQFSGVRDLEQPDLKPPELNSRDAAGAPATICGERVWREHPQSFWLAGVDGYRSKGAKSIVGEPGQLLLTESNLFFLAQSRFANAEPALTLPLASVAEVRLDKYVLGRRLVVQLDTGKVHSFEIHTAGGIWQDKAGMQAAGDFIQSKIEPNQMEK
jgi:hypothetical protein